MIGASLEARRVTNESRALPSTTSPPVFRARAFEGVAVGLEPGEFVGGGLGGPARLAPAHGAAVGGGRGGHDPVGPGLAGDVGGRVGAGLAAVGLGVEGQFPAAGQRHLERRPWRCRAAGTRRRGPGRTISIALPARRAFGLTATSTRPGTSPTSQRTVCRHDRSRSLSSRVEPAEAPPPEVADHQGRDVPLAERLGHQGGVQGARAVDDLGEDGRPRLDVADLR